MKGKKKSKHNKLTKAASAIGRGVSDAASTAGYVALSAGKAASGKAIEAGKAAADSAGNAAAGAKNAIDGAVESMDEVKMQELLGFLYQKSLDGIPHVSESVDELADDYLSHHKSPEKAAKALMTWYKRGTPFCIQVTRWEDARMASLRRRRLASSNPRRSTQ